MNRRGFIRGMISLVAAPAIVRAASIMPVKSIDLELYGRSPIMGILPSIEQLNKYHRLRQFWIVEWEKCADLLLPIRPPVICWKELPQP